MYNYMQYLCEVFISLIFTSTFICKDYC